MAGRSKDEKEKPTEYDQDNVSKQWQSEGTPRDFDQAEARETSRNIAGGNGREHYSEVSGNEDEFEEDEEFEDDDE